MHVIADWVFDPHSRYLSSGDARHRLSPKAAKVLLSLVQDPGRVWSRETLLDAAWPSQAVGEEVLTQVIAELRRAFRDDFRRPRFIETVHKAGYRLVAGSAGEDGSGELPGGWAADLEAYGTYLQALTLRETSGLAGLHSAIELYVTALRMNPRLAVAHAGLAEALLFTDYVQHPMEVARVRSHCEAALRLEGGLAEAWSVHGHACAYRADFGGATDLIRRAMALGPGNGAVFYQAARVCMSAMAFAPAAALLERAGHLSPGESHALVLAGKLRGILGEPAASHRNFMAALPRLDARLAEHPDDFRARTGRARCLYALGRREEATEDMDLARAHPEPMAFHLACTLAQNGRTEAALDTLEQVVELGWRGPWARPWLDRDSDFDPLRGNRRFARLAARVGPPG
nr:winged helix-turn-helix domain-containing protein [uncultured Phenylobacterium sp.]